MLGDSCPPTNLAVAPRASVTLPGFLRSGSVGCHPCYPFESRTSTEVTKMAPRTAGTSLYRLGFGTM